jgi:hypothetical protein
MDINALSIHVCDAPYSQLETHQVKALSEWLGAWIKRGGPAHETQG